MLKKLYINISKVFVIIVAITILSSIIYISTAQNKNDLNNKKEALESEIQMTSQLLNEVRQSKEASTEQLVLIEKKTNQINDLVSTYQSEIQFIEEDIENNNTEIDTLSSQSQLLIEQFNQLIYSFYKSKNSHNRLLFILSSENFNQAFRRVKYIQHFTNYIMQFSNELNTQQIEIDSVNTKLSTQKEDLKNLSIEKEDLLITLEEELVEKDKLIIELKGKESDLRAEIAQKTNIKRDLENQIAEIIRKEIEATNASNAANTANVPTPEEVTVLSSSFESNKGILPWPSASGVLSRGFGDYAHPVIPGIMVPNDGLEIMVPKGSYCRAIFEGTVSAVIKSPDNLWAVIVRHGNYRTVYSNLETVNVKENDKITIKQSIGKVHTDTKDNKTVLGFQIWKNSSPVNPSYWLSK